MRVFIAITPPTNVRQIINLALSHHRTAFNHLRWYEPEKFHLTLGFWGKISTPRLADLEQGIAQVTTTTKAFVLSIGRLSYFYKRHEDSIVFLDIPDPDRELRSLHKNLRKRLAEDRFFLPERITPHITVGRAKRTRYSHQVKKVLADVIKPELPPLGTFEVNKIDLYQSHYNKSTDSHHYRRIRSFPLC